MEAHTTDSVLGRVRQIIEETTGTENAAIDARLMDVCADSLEAASVVTDLEDEFSIDIDGLGPYLTVGELVRRIDKEK